jgi:hypothetical protein
MLDGDGKPEGLAARPAGPVDLPLPARSGSFLGMSDTADNTPPTAEELEAELEEVEEAIEKAKHSEAKAKDGERPKDWT